MKKGSYLLILVVIGLAGLVWLKSGNRPATKPTVVGYTSPVAPISAQASAPKQPSTGQTELVQPTERSVASQSAKPSGIFGAHGPVTMADIQSSALRTKLLTLNDQARAAALRQLEDLKIPVNNTPSLRVSTGGQLYYVCSLPSIGTPQAQSLEPLGEPKTSKAEAQSSGSQPVQSIAAATSASPPALHSRPGATKILFLDFKGTTVANTVWNTEYNGGAPFTCLPYSTDSDTSTFSDLEQAAITRTWERVAEDYRPFDIDVTTEEPANMDSNVVHVVITSNTRADGTNNPEAAAGGASFLAMLGSPDWATHTPAFVYHNNVQEETGMAEAISHEAGHYIGGLSHDGTTYSEYYGGHGTGETSWGPIMGAPYGRKITQWSKGEYYMANNPEDDLAILAGKLGYIADDHGDTNASATPLTVTGNAFSGTGIINTTGETDRFSITLGASKLTINVNPFPADSNSPLPLGEDLDIQIELLDAAGNIVASDNPYNSIRPRLSLTVAPGTYYLRVTPTGSGFPTSSITPTGYTVYGCLGRYNIIGTFSDSGPQLAPHFTTQPLNKNLRVGDQSQFNAVATGTPDPLYQWQRMPAGTSAWENLIEGGSYHNVNTSGFIINGLTPSMSGDQFRCVATNSEGIAISGMALLSVEGDVSPIDTQPVNAEIYPGGKVIFEMEYHGSADVRWYHNGVLVKENLNYSNPTAFYVINSASLSDAGGYYATFTQSGVVYTSDTVQLVVSSTAAPFILTDATWPTGVHIGSNITLTVDVRSVVPPTYQWRYNGIDIPGATSSSYEVTNISFLTAGPYDVVVTNPYGTTTGKPFTFDIDPSSPVISQQPIPQAVFPGETATFAIAALGPPPLTYRWQSSTNGFEWIDLTEPSQYHGVNESQLSVTTSNDLDGSAYRCIVTKYDGNFTTSDAASLTVGEFAPLFTSQPSSQSIREEQSVTFIAAATGGSVSQYWQRLIPGGTWSALTDNGAYSGVSTPNLTITATTLSMDGDQFRVVATNSAGTSFSDVATLAVITPVPVITMQPLDQCIRIGDPITLSVLASSEDTISYQWQKDGEQIPEATNSTFVISHAQDTDLGIYTVVVSNRFGSVTSGPAAVFLAVAPTITADPLPQTVFSGESVTFSATVASNAPLSYQWLKNDDLIANATNSSFTIASAQVDDDGDYTVVVTNIAGSATSASATLTVNPSVAPIITQEPTSLSRRVDQAAMFTIAAAGSPTPTYQWQVKSNGSGTWSNLSEGSSFVGIQTSSLTVTHCQLANNRDQYRCVVSNVAGSVTSDAATLTVSAASFAKVSSGRYHSLRLSTTGQLYATGTNTYGQLGNDTTSNAISPQLITIPGQTVTDIAAGGQHSLFLTASHDLWAVGFNGNDQLGDGTTTSRSTPYKLADDVVAMAAGYFHSAFIKSDGSLWICGGNDSGQLGNGTTTDAATPIQIATDVSDVALGIRQTFFLKADGTLWGAGDMYNNGTTVSTPIQIATHVTAIAAGGYHSLFLKDDGSLWTLGYNGYGQLGNASTTTSTTPVQVTTGVQSIAAGYFHSAFIKTDHTLWVMGRNDSGSLGDVSAVNRLAPFQLDTNVEAVSASESYTLYIKLDGSLWGIGYNAYGQFGNGTTTVTSTPVQITTGAVLAPNAPSDFVATAAAPFDRVFLTWSAQAAAASYEVWRSTTNDSTTATRIAALRWPFFEDLNVTSGQTYFYWLKAVNASGDSDFTASASVVTGNVLSQSITFTGPVDQGYSATPITLSATASSGLPVTFTLVSGPATLNGDQLTLTGPGTVIVRAAQPGNGAYAAAANVDRSFTVSTANAAITLGDLQATYDGNPHAASATTDPTGLNVTFTYDGNATVPTNAGSYAVTGTINDPNYQGSASGTLAIDQATQTITFAPLSDVAYGTTPIPLSASASSGLTVTFTVLSGPASFSGNSLALTGAGTVTVRAAQAGDANHLAAANVDRTFAVTGNLAAWQAGYFTTGELADPSISGPTADPDHDGLSNLLEYALGLDPKHTDTIGLPEMSTTASDWVYTFTRPADRPDLTYTVEVSSDLVTWSSSGISLSMTAASGGTQTWQASYPLSSTDKVFFRLKVTQ